MVNSLGFFPDKVLINTLTMIAEDYSNAACEQIYQSIRDLLVDPKVAVGRKLPLVYLFDSILKNARGHYIELMEMEETSSWVNAVHEQLSQANREEDLLKLRRVLNTWKQFHIFKQQDVVDRLLAVYTKADQEAKERAMAAQSLLSVPPAVKMHMQRLLDDMHEGIDELDKLSLERLAIINPDLLATIKHTAQQIILESNTANSTSKSNETLSPTSTIPITMFGETRSQEEIDLSHEWDTLKINLEPESQTMVQSLQHLLLEHTSASKPPLDRNFATDNMLQPNQWVTLLACVSVCASQLTNRLQSSLQVESKRLTTTSNTTSHVRHVNKADFTNEGLQTKHDWVIGRLYTEGMPFVSAADGRRFATQQDLSNHLDNLFRVNQASKTTMANTNERGWYTQEITWTGEQTTTNISTSSQLDTQTGVQAAADAQAATVPADETRSKCSICGLNFFMVFDNEEGEYMYSNCREMPLDNIQLPKVLTHSTCWTALGSPEYLTKDQILVYTE